MIVINRSQRLLSIAAPGHGLGVLLLVPLDRVEVPPELDETVLAALEGPLRTYVAQGQLDIEDTPPAAAPALPELVGNTPIGIEGPVALSDCVHPPPPAAELEPRRVVTLETTPELEATPELEPAPELEPTPEPAPEPPPEAATARTASRAKRR